MTSIAYERTPPPLDLDRLIRLPSLPTVAIELLRALSHPEVAAYEVVNLISADPALSGKVLAAANSARYRGSRPIGDIHRASMLLGKRVVSSLALGFSLADASMSRGEHADLFRTFWLRSFAQALAARTLAERYGGCPPDEAFTLGLIAHIGQLGLLKHLAAPFAACLAEAELTNSALEIVEQRRLGLTSHDLTLRLLEKWNVPDHFLGAVRRQTLPSAETEPPRPGAELATCLRVAAAAADFISGKQRGIHLVRLSEALQELPSASEEDVEWLVIAVSKLLRQNAELFHVDLTRVGTPSELLSEATEQLAQLAATGFQCVEEPSLPQELMEENGQLRHKLEELTRETTIDPLTAVFNRRYFHQRLSEQMRRAEQTGTTVAVLMADVDYFKTVNDTYGHATGDKLLQAVAQTIEGTVRGGDLVARYGGEEFVILAEAPNLDGLRTVGERIRRAVSEIVLPTTQGPLTVTISLGGCIAAPTGELPDFESRLLGDADRNLYAAKADGRNRVVATPLSSPLPVSHMAAKPRSLLSRLCRRS